MKTDLYEPVCREIIMPLWAKWEKSLYLTHLKEQRRLQYDDRERIRAYQLEKLKQLVLHAYTHCPFYKELYSGQGVHPQDIKTWSDFNKLPILTKTHVREHHDGMLAENIPKSQLVSGKTSGSTGKPIDFFRDEPGTQVERASILLVQGWAGYRLGAKIFSMFGQSTSTVKRSKLRVVLRRRLLNRSHNISTLNLTEPAMEAFYHLLKENRKPFLYGYAHTLHLFAEYLESKGYNDVQAGGVLSGGMVLYDHQRALIEKVFQCKVTNNYGSEEFGVMACECEKHDGLHINAATKHVEILRDDYQDAANGEAGHIVITSLTNYGMPFIRYQIEDMATATDRMCACGRGYPLMERIEGRDSDFIVTPEGKRVSGISLTDNFGANIPGVVQLQMVQDRPDHIVLNVVKADTFGDISKQTTDDLCRKFFGDNMHYTFSFVDDIPKGPRGKIRFVISQIVKGGA